MKFLMVPHTSPPNEKPSCGGCIDNDLRRNAEIVHLSPDFIGTLGLDRRPIYINPAGLNLIRVPLDTDVSIIDVSKHHPEWAMKQTFEVSIPEAERKGMWVGESVLITSEGEEIAVSQAIFPHYDSLGRIAYYSVVMRDIRPLKKTQRELHENAAMMQGFFESAGALMGVMELMDDGDIIHITDNPRTVSFFVGVPIDLTCQITCRNLKVSETVIEQWRNACLESLETGKPVHFYYSHTYPVGLKHLSTTVCHIASSSSKRPRFAYVAEDITERRRSEMSRLRFFSLSLDLFIIISVSGKIVDASGGWKETLGMSYDELLGSDAMEYVADEDKERAAAELINNFSGVSSSGFLMRMRHKDGGIRWIQWNSLACPDEGIMYAAGRDLTSELAAVQMSAEADKFATIGTMTAGIAHEFKNYLAGILGNATFALDELDNSPVSDSIRESLSHIVDACGKANGVAMSLLSYSRTPHQEFSLEDITSVVDRTVSMMRVELSNANIDIKVVKNEVPAIQINSSRIQQVLLNLLINAKHAMKDGGVITVTVRRTANCVFVEVSDTGCGIAPENLGRVFDPYFSTKGEWGKDSTSGTGLGLSISRNIALDHGGDLTVQSTQGVGTTFTLRIPIVRQSQPDTQPIAKVCETL